MRRVRGAGEEARAALRAAVDSPPCRGLRWKDASVVKRADRVYLKTVCKDHGLQETLYCANAAFFDKVMGFALVKRTTRRRALRV